MKVDRYVKNTVLMSAAGPVTSAIPTPTRYVVGTAEHIFATKAINTKPAKNFILPTRLVSTDCQYEQYIFFFLFCLANVLFPITETKLYLKHIGILSIKRR